MIMRFMIVSAQGSSVSPDGSPGNNMQVLDMIDAPNAEEAIEVFKEDNIHFKEAGFTEFLCIPLSVERIINFIFE